VRSGRKKRETGENPITCLNSKKKKRPTKRKKIKNRAGGKGKRGKKGGGDLFIKAKGPQFAARPGGGKEIARHGSEGMKEKNWRSG